MFSDYGIEISHSNKSLIKTEIERTQHLIVALVASVANLTALANEVEVIALNQPKAETSRILTKFDRAARLVSGKAQTAWDVLNRLQQIVTNETADARFVTTASATLNDLNQQLQQSIEEVTLSRCLVDHYRGHGAREVQFSKCDGWLHME